MPSAPMSKGCRLWWQPLQAPGDALEVAFGARASPARLLARLGYPMARGDRVVPAS